MRGAVKDHHFIRIERTQAPQFSYMLLHVSKAYIEKTIKVSIVKRLKDCEEPQEREIA